MRYLLSLLFLVFLSVNAARADFYLPPASSGGGGSGTVTSVTFTGDGIVDSATPSTAVTTSGTVTATPLTTAQYNFLGRSASGTGAFSFQQINFSYLAGSVLAAQMPALTGDVTTTAGTVATTVAAIQGTTVSGTSGSGNVAFTTSPTFTTPALGTPSAGVLSSCSGYPTATTAATGASPALTSGQIAIGQSSGAIAAETPSGDLTLAANGAFTIGANKVTYAKMQQASTVTLLGNPTGGTANVQEITLGAGLTFSGSTLATTGGSGTVTSSGSPVSGNIAAFSTSTNIIPATTTGTGSTVVLATSPTLVTPVLGTPSSGSLGSCTGYPASALTGQVAGANGGTGQSAYSAGFGGNGADGAISNPSAYTAPISKSATTFSLTGANTLTVTNSPLFIYTTSTFTLGDSSNASTITLTPGGSNVYGGGTTGANGSIGTAGAGPGFGSGTSLNANTSDGGGGGGNGAAGGSGGQTTGYVPDAGGSICPFSFYGGSGGGAGCGGTSSGTGGAGGKGAGSVIICSIGAISLTSVSVVNIKGQAGSNATTNGGGGGAGAGGDFGAFSQTSNTLAGTINVSGANGGNGAGTAPAAGGGGGSGAGQGWVYSPSNSVGSLTFTATGGTGGNATTGGSAGGTGGTTAAIINTVGTPNNPIMAYFDAIPATKENPLGPYKDRLAFAAIVKTQELLGRTHQDGPNKLVDVSPRTLAWIAGKDLEGMCYYMTPDMQGTSCMGVGDEVDTLKNAA